ncbi:hypothetical protein QZH41_012212 [Actinostola sp. cb2023]|nr:hypothetical protein QZH41_012212 [Actinostola sp. cb2023]
MQRSSTVEQNKKIQLDFSGGESTTFTLKRNLATTILGEAMWEVLPFPEVRASWVKITILTVYSTSNNGFKEIEIYKRDAQKGKLCDRLDLPVGVTSELQPLFGQTVSLVLKSGGAKVILHEGNQASSKKYTFVVGTGGKCTFSRYDGSSDSEKATNSSCSTVVSSSGLRSVWIDFRCANIIFGSGTDVILQWQDTALLDVAYMSFHATTESEVISCHRENHCCQDADHFWPLDKVSGGEVLDINGDKNGVTNLSNSDFTATFQARNMFSMAPLIDTKTAGNEKYVILGDFRGECIQDPDVGDFTLSFWTMIPTSITNFVDLLHSSTTTHVGFKIAFIATNHISIKVMTRTELHKVKFRITKGKHYNVAVIWSKKKNTLKALVNGVHYAATKTTKSHLEPEEPYVTIGQIGNGIGSFYFSNLAVWKRELSIKQLTEKLDCSHVGNVDESCSPAVKATCGTSYTEAQCLSVGCCYAGNQCFKRDGHGSKGKVQYTAAILVYNFATLIYPGWSPRAHDSKRRLELDTEQIHAVSDIVIQGSGSSSFVHFVSSFLVSHSKSCAVFTYIMDGSAKKVFTGNTDSTGIVTVALPSTVDARCFRIEPKTFIGKIAMKAKLLGTRRAKHFHGCFKSGTFVSAEYYNTRLLTPEKCITSCGRDSKAYAALKYGRYCLCGTAVDAASAVDKAMCNLPCTGNPRLTCGSNEAYSVYSVTGSFPSSLSCSFPSNVTSLTTFSGTCRANSIVTCDFGESLPVTTENAPVKYSYYSVPGDFAIACRGSQDMEGESSLIYSTISVYDDFHAELKCPSYATTGTRSYCFVKVLKGTDLSVLYQWNGQASPIEINLCDAIGFGIGDMFDTPVIDSPEPTSGETILLVDSILPDEGQLIGLELNVERSGCISMQILRPICGSGSQNTYQYVNGNVEIQQNACSSPVNIANCTEGQTFSTDFGNCVVNGSLPENSTSVPPIKWEVVTVNDACLPGVGRQKVYFESANISNFKRWDIFALRFPDNASIKLSRRDSVSTKFSRGSTVVTYSQPNKGVGTIIAPTGGMASFVEYSIVLLTKMTCQMRIPFKYDTVGVYSEKITVKSRVRTQDMAAQIQVQETISNLTWSYAPGAVLNEPYIVNVTVQNGSNMTAVLRFDNVTVQNVSWDRAVTEYPFTHTYSKRQYETIVVIVSNGISLVYKECRIKVQINVAGLKFTRPISPVTYPAMTVICFKLTDGDEVTISSDYGNGLSSTNGTFDIGDVFIGCFNHSHNLGVYDVSIKASNLASQQTILQTVIVENKILGLTFSIEQEFSHEHVEVNETICVVCNVTQGTTPTYIVSWGDGQNVSGLQNRFCHKFTEHRLNNIQVTAKNNVSFENVSKETRVHKPVYPLKNFKVVCPPTNFTDPTSCVLTIEGGNDFECTWRFGDGFISVSNDLHVGQPYYHNYTNIGYYDVVLNCTNRLYNATITTLAIVEITMTKLHIGTVANCPHGQTATAYVAVDTGSGVEFTVNKTNFYTRESVHLTPVFNPEITNGTVTFHCSVIGVYCMEATSLNNVTARQFFTMCFKIDVPIAGATTSRWTEEIVTVGDTSILGTQMTKGSNVTCYYDFEDDSREPPHFNMGIYPASGMNVSHIYQRDIDALVTTICNNSVSEVQFRTPIKAQHPHKDIFLVCSDPQPFPPGQIQCTVNKPSGIPLPTNSSCTIDHGDDHHATKPFHGPVLFPHAYHQIGGYDINVTCTNDISSVNLQSSAEVQTPLDNDVTNFTTSGGLYGSRGIGRGKNSSYYPTKSTITLDADWGNGTNVSLSVDWGDSSHSLVMNNTCSHEYSNPGEYEVKVVMENALNSKTKTYIFHLQERVAGFQSSNNGPIALQKAFYFTLSADKVGTDTCFSLDIGNGTSFLYKPSASTICEPECSYGAIVRYYSDSSIPLNISHVHKYIGNYKIVASACNIVSRIVSHNLANVSPKPCKYPKLNFTRTEANTTRDYPVKYRKSIQFPITPIIKIDCEATKLSRITWKLQKCSKDNEFCTTFAGNCSQSIAMTHSTLRVPARCLPYGVFSVSCTVEMLGGGTKGIFAEAVGYFEVTKTPLIAAIVGGTSKTVGNGKTITFDGTISLDPDTKDDSDIKFYWFCWERSERLNISFNSTLLPGQPVTLHDDLQVALNQSNGSANVPSSLYKGCLGHGPGRMDVPGHKITFNTKGMRINHTYDITLLVCKDTRWSTTIMSIDIVSGSPPDCKITCISNCGKKLTPSDKHALKVECTCPECGPLEYSWELYKLDKITNEMVAISDFPSMTITALNFINLVVKPHSLHGDCIYDFKIKVFDTVNRVMGHSAREAKTNPSPKNGYCDVVPRLGNSDTLFNISCIDWEDDDEYVMFSINLHDSNTNIDTPLYQMRSDTKTSFITSLPVGKEERGFNQTIRVRVCDPLLACKIVDREVQVKLKEKDESEFQEFLTDLCDNDGTMNVLRGEGRIDELCTFIFNSISNMKALQDGSPSWSYEIRIQIEKVVAFSMNQTCIIISSDPKKATCKASVISLLLSVNIIISDYTKKQAAVCLMEAASDVSNFPPSELESAATGMASALGMSLSSAATGPSDDPAASTDAGGVVETTKSPEELQREKEERTQQTMNLMGTLDSINNAFLSQMVGGESKEIHSALLNMTAFKQQAGASKPVSSSSGTSIGFPKSFSENSTESIAIKLNCFGSNPLSMVDGANDVNSPLIDLSFGNEDGSNKEVKDISEPMVIMIKQTGKKINMSRHEISREHCIYHMIEVPKNHSSIFIEILPSDENLTFNLYLKRDTRPTKLEHAYNFTVDNNTAALNVTDGKSPYMWFLSNDELNRTAAGTWKLAVCVDDEDGAGESDLFYNISMFTAACMFYNTTSKQFSTAGVEVGPLTTRDITQCLVLHATSFAADFFVPPNSIDWSKISLDELLKNPIVFIIVMVIFGLYFLLLIWARRADKKDLDKIGLTPLPDNDPRDTYLYEIVVYTGHVSGGGTTSDVYMVLSGGLDETSPRQLCDPEPSRKKFGRGSVDYFLLAVPRSLGKLKQLRIWHNNKGDDPSWFLQRVMIRDLQVDKKTWFVNLRWLAVEEDDGMVERFLHPATKEELTNFSLLFSTEARKNLTDNHLWFSVIARPAKSTFTRVQRLSCCLSIILTTMVANAMFYQVGDESSSGTSIHIGPFSFSIKQVSIGITSSMVVLPINILVVTIFRKIRPPDPKLKAKTVSEQDPNNQSDKYKAEDDVPKIVVSDNDVEEEEDEEQEKEEEEEEEQDKDKKSKKKEKKKKKSATLSPKFTYLAYVLIFLASTVSGTFTVFYGLTFGKEKSVGWISSMMISFWQDVLISQPLKVFAAAMFFALVIKDPNKGEDENEQQNELNPDEELAHKNAQNTEEEKTLRKMGFVEKPPDPEKLEAYRQFKLKQKQMKTILYEIMQYMFFLIVVLIIAYGNRDPMAYGVTRAMDAFFVSSRYSGMDSFDSSDRSSKYWEWVEQSYIATLRPRYWYGPLEKFNESDIESVGFEMNTEVLWMKERNASNRWQITNGNYAKNPTVLYKYPQGFVADHATGVLVGSPRIRQLRVKKNQNTMLPFISRMFAESNADYEWDLEDKQSYHEQWRPFEGNDTKDEKSKSPWYYRSAWELKGTPYWGFFASYWAGGFVADLGSDRLEAEKMIANLSAMGWIDRYSRALFAEFTIYNPYTNFFSAVTLLTEIRATGGYHHMPKVQTIRLYRYIGPEMFFVMACEITYIAFLVYFLYKQVKKYRADKHLYFKDAWNYLEIAVLSFSIASVGFYFARLGMTKLTINNMKKTPDSFVSFQYVAFLDEWVSATCSLAVFFSFLKFLRLLRFNRRMALLTQTLKQASKPLFYFFIYFSIIFLAYALFGFSIFSMSDKNYASFQRTIVTLFGMTLGEFDFHALMQANRIFGPLYFFSYVVLILFILMNVFLSIIVDTFNEVSRDVLKQGNDHEMLSFMIHSVKSNIGKKCGPAIKPTYVEEKSPLEKDIDSIDEISDNIQYAFRNMCMEDIRQVKWLEPRKSGKKKKLVMKMLLEDEENFTENDICDAIPVLDDFIANNTVEEIIRMMIFYREKKQQDELAEDVSKMSESSAESDEMEDTDISDDFDDSDDDAKPKKTTQHKLSSRRRSSATHI